MNSRWMLGVAAGLLISAGVGMAALGMGPQNMVLASGTMDQVPFPHGRHQEALKDCTACHDIFPKEGGSIQRMIGDGTLKKKTVMTACMKCHRSMSQAGLLTGPVSCKKCHSVKGPAAE